MGDNDRHEEGWNSLTHLAGLIASIAGSALLIVLAVRRADPWLIAGVSVYGATLILLYAASALYHGVSAGPAKRRLKALDHAAIFLLIAGTYTPFVLVPLRGVWGWSLFGIVWGGAAVGVVFKLFAAGRFPVVSTIVYIVLGWVVIVAVEPLVRAVPAATLAWLIAGGVTYTAGTGFYASRRIPYGHTVWHLFVLGGSTCHAVAVASLLVA